AAGGARAGVQDEVVDHPAHPARQLGVGDGALQRAEAGDGAVQRHLAARHLHAHVLRADVGLRGQPRLHLAADAFVLGGARGALRGGLRRPPASEQAASSQEQRRQQPRAPPRPPSTPSPGPCHRRSRETFRRNRTFEGAATRKRQPTCVVRIARRWRRCYVSPAMQRYFEITRKHSYSLLFALPLLVLYELGAALISGDRGGLRNGADVMLRTLLAAGGVRSTLAFTAIMLVVAAFLIARERRRQPIP